MEFINKFIAIIFSMFILLNGIYYRRKIGTWMSPVCIFSLFWFLYTFIPLVFLINEPINCLGVIFIFICVFLFSLPSLLFKWKAIFVKNRTENQVQYLFDTVFFRTVVIGSIIIAIIGDIYQVIYQGVTLFDILLNTLEVGSELANKRYNEEIELSSLGIMGTFCSFLSVALAGLLYGSSKSKLMKKIALLSFFPSLIVLFTQSQKGMFLIGIFFFLAGIMVNKLYKKDFNLFSKVVVYRGLLSIGIGIPLLAVSFISRGLLDDVGDTSFIYERIIDNFTSYTFGHLYCFSDWFNFYTGGISKCTYQNLADYQWGKYSFMTVWKILFGYKHPTIGYFGEVLELNNGNSFSNVFTMFRGIVLDFGIAGAFLSFIIFGCISNYYYYCFLLKKNNAISITFIIFFVAFTYYSAFASFFAGGSSIFLFIATYIIIYINGLFIKSKKRQAF